MGKIRVGDVVIPVELRKKVTVGAVYEDGRLDCYWTEYHKGVFYQDDVYYEGADLPDET